MTHAWLWRLLPQAFFLAAFVAGAAYAAYLVGPPIAEGAIRAIAIATHAVPLDRREPERTDLGRLRYLGGLSLTSKDKAFGGLSGLLFEHACGRLLAVNDVGSWLILEPEEQGDRLVGVRTAIVAPILDPSGKPPPRKYFADAEAVMRDPATGDTLVWFELDHRAQRYRGVSACKPASLAMAAHAVERPQAIQRWRSNKGVEAAAPDGQAILLLAEGQPEGAEHIAAVRIAGGTVTHFRYPAAEGFLATSLAELAPGLHVLLQRSRSPTGGFYARLSLLRVAAEGTTERFEVARLAPPLVVDNMEGIAVRREGSRTFLYIVSDNNFLPTQRTLLMKFELLADDFGISQPPFSPVRASADGPWGRARSPES
ncbi:esterase-like activity of phytase family protein [Thermaurantiacus sp.]